ncbi:hypothetical protein GCM10007067_22640 [Lysobacter bugurensis]|uniref:histidine kinase n=2 Tax=Cognatilysobacter bugurensis TaxID=543356 RepID=A0A918W994_9GAMM|nr:hypothetical protein GCM10007067_22640 [Lysobacter bugurensis]
MRKELGNRSGAATIGASLESTAQMNRTSFLFSAGTSMAARCREYPWATSALGEPHTWDSALQTLVPIILASNQPMFVAWGDSRTLIYNDAYAAILADKHPDALGKDLLDVLHEISDDILPIVQQAYNGIPVQMDEIEVWLERRGYREETHFSFFYSPVRDEQGDIGGFFCACNETTAQVFAERRIAQSEAHHRGVLENMDEGFTLFDRDFTILEVNPTALRLVGLTREQMVGQNHWELFPGTRDGVVGALYQRVLAEQRPLLLEHLYSFPDGREVWFELRAFPVGDGLAALYRDVTDRKLAEQELREANQRKDEFLAMLAHELRNPLAPIRAAADVLAMPSTDESRIRRTSEIISRQVKHMTSLVDDLLDVSRVTRGLVVLEKERVSLKWAASTAIEQVRPLIEARKHHLTLQSPPGNADVSGDPKRLVQVLTNLLNNAAKFTPEGGHIVLTIEAEDEKVSITVADDGIGMSTDMARRAFALFSQAERASDRSQGGLGIGLALVKSLVELHAGTVTATSAGAGAGSQFTVCLPRQRGEPSRARDVDDGTRDAPSRKLRVLIVDDNQDAATMLEMFLAASGHTVMTEHGSRQGLERALADQPDVCLLDIGLPDMDGNELARRLRERPEMEQTVLIAVTGYGQDSDRQSTAAAGFDHHLVKPIDPLVLTRILAAEKAR